MKLDEVHALDAHAFEGKMNLALGLVVRAATGLGCEKKTPGIPSKPRRNPQFRVTITGCNVYMVDAVAQQHLKRLIRFLLRDV